MAIDFYLASRSPRRRELLTLIGAAYQALDTSVDETLRPELTPEEYVRAMALAKARAGQKRAADSSLPVLGADTAVVLGGEVMGKPRDEADAQRMLSSLGGRWHEVLSAFSLVQAEREKTDCTRTRVLMAELSESEIARYWACGEPADKAGAYAVQGRGSVWVREIRGSYTGVVGLPLYETLQALKEFGVAIPGRSRRGAEVS